MEAVGGAIASYLFMCARGFNFFIKGAPRWQQLEQHLHESKGHSDKE
jgi:hypothetical protein